MLNRTQRAAESELAAQQGELSQLRAVSGLKTAALKAHHEFCQRILKQLEAQVAKQTTRRTLLFGTNSTCSC